jgi:hypothetical protein
MRRRVTFTRTSRRRSDPADMTLITFGRRWRDCDVEAARRAGRALDRLVDDADAPGRGLWCVPPEHRATIAAARREVSALAADLAVRERCEPQAVQLAADIGQRGVLPLFTASGARRTLDDALLARTLLRGPLEEAS